MGFQLLLGFRHTHLELLRLHLPRRDFLVWALRSELSHFVSQVLLYFQQDVIEAASVKLSQAVDASKEFNEVVGAHEDFLATLTSHCFLKTPELHSALMAALRICAAFCSLASGDSGASSLNGEFHRLQFEFTSTV